VSDQVKLTIEKTDDPWIDAYLAFRGAVLNGELETVADAEKYAREAQRGLPAGGRRYRRRCSLPGMSLSRSLGSRSQC
jgi:hypothetical protein